MQGAQIIRVHDVKETVEAMRARKPPVCKAETNLRVIVNISVPMGFADVQQCPHCWFRDFVLKLATAGKVLARHGSRKIIIGKDTRISGYMLSPRWRRACRRCGLSACLPDLCQRQPSPI